MSKLTTSTFQNHLDEHLATLREQIECHSLGLNLDDEASEKRRHRASTNFLFFCETYFPHYFDPNSDRANDQAELANDPSDIHHSPFLLDVQRSVVEKLVGTGPRPGLRWVRAAPRGNCKSSTISMALPIWCDLFGHKRYVVIAADTSDQAVLQLQSIVMEYEANTRLANDFPDAMGKGRVWTQSQLTTPNGMRIEAAGSTKTLRGRRAGSARPDLLIGDDLENDENVIAPQQRDKLHRWLLRSFLKLGPPDGSADVLLVGTVLHYDAVLTRLLRSPLWDAHIFKAIQQWPDRLDLWEAWEQQLLQNGSQAADAYYDQHHDALHTGAEVAWPAVQPLHKLMQFRADDHAAFQSEYQNEPVDNELAVFDQLHIGTPTTTADLTYFGAVDPSMGKKRRHNDPSAILIGAIDFTVARPILYVLEATIARLSPDAQMQRIIELQQQYDCHSWAIETIQFQEFFAQQLEAHAAQQGTPLPITAVRPNTDKALRIEALQPFVSRGQIAFAPGLDTLTSQLRYFPLADHDDGPDCLEMLWKIAWKNRELKSQNQWHAGNSRAAQTDLMGY